MPYSCRLGLSWNTMMLKNIIICTTVTLLLLFFISSNTFASSYSEAISADKNNNHKTSFKLYLDAAEQGDKRAYYRLGSMYKNGLGTTKNLTKGLYWFEKSANNDEADGLWEMALAYDFGKGVKQDISSAMIWYQKLTTIEKRSRALYNMAINYHTGGENFDKNIRKAIVLYELSAQYRKSNYSNYSPEFNLAVIYQKGDKDIYKDLEQAIYWYKKAKDVGVMDAKKPYLQLMEQFKKTHGDTKKYKEMTQSWGFIGTAKKVFLENMFYIYGLYVLLISLIVAFKKYRSSDESEGEKQTILAHQCLRNILLLLTGMIIIYTLFFARGIVKSDMVIVASGVLLILYMFIKPPAPRLGLSVRLGFKNIFFLSLSFFLVHTGYYISERVFVYVADSAQYITSNRNYDEWVPVQAMVISSLTYEQSYTHKTGMGPPKKGKFNVYKFAYSYFVDGIRYQRATCTLEFFDDDELCYKKFYDGQEIDIFYQPGTPEYSTVYKTTSGFWGYLVGFLYVILIVLPLTLIVLSIGALFLVFGAGLVANIVRELSGYHGFMFFRKKG